MAARMATARAGPNRWRTTLGLRAGRLGRSRWWGSPPISGAERRKRTATSVTRTTATIDEGTRFVILGHTSITTTTSAPRSTVTAEALHEAPLIASHAESSTEEPVPFAPPNSSGTCWRAMVTAIPTVNPSSTGQGTNWIIRPSPLKPMATTITPAMMATEATAPTPS